MGLKIENLTGGYGSFPVLKEVSLEVNNGELVGLIGLNGAGKSTLIKHIIGLLSPMKGKIEVDGDTLKTAEKKYYSHIGFIPETPSLYEELTLKEHIEVTAMAYDIPMDVAWERVQPLLKKFRLEEKLDWFPVHFSKGMKQKVMILCAFMIEPTLCIIDEPFLGLDPLAIDSLLQLMVEAKEAGAAILMSTHILATAEKFCDRFIVLHEGKVLATGTLEELQAQFSMPNASLDEIYLSLTKENMHG